MAVGRYLGCLLILGLSCLAAHAQLVSEATPQEIVNGARKSTATYFETFKNLLSEEKKTFEIFDAKGAVKKKKVVESTFLVYQLTKDQGRVAEFRNVVAVDGKPVAEADKRAREFFAKVVASDNPQKEFERIRDESTRFDEDFAISGLTLFQAIALSDELRGKFRYTMAGRESIGGKNVYVMLFEQIRPDDAITVNKPEGPHNYDIEIVGDKSVELDARIRGKLWIDAETFAIRRELRERTIQPLGFAIPVVVAEDLLEYTDSEFGILTPKVLEHVQYKVNLKDQKAIKDAKITFEYGRFTKPDVEVKGEVKDKDQ